MLVLGVGGAGCNILGRIAPFIAAGMPLAVMDTDSQKLKACKAGRKLHFGAAVTGGFSTGGSPDMGRRAAESDAAAIQSLIADVDLLILVAGIGGGTGGGALPFIARTAASSGTQTLCLLTTPFSFEEGKKRAAADAVLPQIQSAADAVVLLPNQRLMDAANEKPSMEEALKQSDRMLQTGVEAIWKLLGRPGLLNLDFGQIRTMLRECHGFCHFASVEGSVTEGMSELIGRLVEYPLFDKGAVLKQCHGLLLQICAGPLFRVDQVERIVTGLREYLCKDVRFRWGVTLDDSMEGRISLTVLAAETWQTREPESNRLAPSENSMIGKQRNKQAEQGELSFTADNRNGRFHNVTPTLYHGENLDVPTYLRRNIRLPL